MHKDAVKITVEVWVRKENLREAVDHLIKAAVDMPAMAEQIQISTGEN